MVLARLLKRKGPPLLNRRQTHVQFGASTGPYGRRKSWSAWARPFLYYLAGVLVMIVFATALSYTIYGVETTNKFIIELFDLTIVTINENTQDENGQGLFGPAPNSQTTKTQKAMKLVWYILLALLVLFIITFGITLFDVIRHDKFIAAEQEIELLKVQNLIDREKDAREQANKKLTELETKWNEEDVAWEAGEKARLKRNIDNMLKVINGIGIKLDAYDKEKKYILALQKNKKKRAQNNKAAEENKARDAAEVKSITDANKVLDALKSYWGPTDKEKPFDFLATPTKEEIEEAIKKADLHNKTDAVITAFEKRVLARIKITKNNKLPSTPKGLQIEIHVLKNAKKDMDYTMEIIERKSQ